MRVHDATFRTQPLPGLGTSPGPWASRAMPLPAEGGVGATRKGKRIRIEQEEVRKELDRIMVAMMLGFVNVATIQKLQRMGYGQLVDQAIQMHAAAGRHVTGRMQADLQVLGINVNVSLGEVLNPNADAPRDMHERARTRDAQQQSVNHTM